MFSKTVKIPQFNDFLPKHPREWSIVTRLTWIYAVSTFCVLLITTLSLYWIFTSRLEKDSYQFFENKIVVLQKLILSESNNPAMLKEETILEPSLYHYYIRIIDKTGKILVETPNMSEIVPTSAYSSISSEAFEPFSKLHWSSKERHQAKKHYLLMSAVIKENGQIIQMAKDVSKQRNIEEDYRHGLLMVLLMGVIGSAILGIIVTQKGLKPLRDITQSTERVTVVQLKERLNPTSLPKELSVLATAFNRMLDRIETGVNRLSQFSADLAHELRTPINNLIGEAEIMLSRPRSNEEYRNVVESSLEEFQRISNMIESLLFLAGAENPEAFINKQKIVISQLMADVIDFYEAVAEEKEVTMICEGTGFIIADSLMLRRVLSNLVSNALRYTQSGGKITLITRTNNNITSISVVDTGIGIPNEHIPYLFNRFYRVDSARSQYTGGTGLGLAIVKSIMDLHKGEVAIESKPGEGTTVTLIFPV